MPLLKNETVFHRWLRDDGHQLVWTSRGRLLERVSAAYEHHNHRTCTFEDAIVFALVNGFKWVRGFPVETKCGKTTRRRFTIKHVRRNDRLEAVIVGTSIWEARRQASHSVWGSDVRAQPPHVRAEREARIAAHMARVESEERTW